MHKHVSTMRTGEGAELIAPYHPSNNLPTLFVNNEQTKGDINITEGIIPNSSDVFSSVAGETNQNLTASQKELLIWHWKLAHIGFQWLQTLMSSPSGNPKLDDGTLNKPNIISTKHPATKTCQAPMCAACALARMTRRNPDIRPSSTPLQEHKMKLKTNDLKPGDCVLLDQYESTVRGRLQHTQGKEPEADQ